MLSWVFVICRLQRPQQECPDATDDLESNSLPSPGQHFEQSTALPNRQTPTEVSRESFPDAQQVRLCRPTTTRATLELPRVVAGYERKQPEVLVQYLTRQNVNFDVLRGTIDPVLQQEVTLKLPRLAEVRENDLNRVEAPHWERISQGGISNNAEPNFLIEGLRSISTDHQTVPALTSTPSLHSTTSPLPTLTEPAHSPSTALHRQLISRLVAISRSRDAVSGVADLGNIFTFGTPSTIALHLHKMAGNSDVCRAVLPPSQTVIALKILRAGNITDSDELDRLAKRLGREISIWKALSHKRVTPLLGFAILEIGACLISPWCANGNALEYLKKCPSTDRRRLVGQVAEALVYLHTHDPLIIHADIKADNVLIDNDGEAMICDFGLSKLLQDIPSGFTTSNGQKGTTRWMAPEQFGEKAVYTTQSDIYAFGCLIIEIMCEKVPFVKYANDIGIALAKVQGKLMEPKDYPEIPEDDPLWSLLRECRATDPQLRPPMSEIYGKVCEINNGYWNFRYLNSIPF